MRQLPKGPRGTILVNLQLIRDPMGSAERWRRRYGDPMTYPPYQGSPLLVVGDSSAIRTLFSAPPESTDQALSERLACVLGESSILALSGAAHSAMRKLLMPPFHGQRLRVYGTQIRDLTRQQMQKIQPGTELVAQDVMHAISMQAIIQLVYGVTEPAHVVEVSKRVTEFRRAMPGAILPVLLPCLRRQFWGFGPWARLQRAIRGLRTVIDQELARRRVEKSEGTDILSLLMAARQEDGTALSDQQIFEQMLALLVAGHSTTAIALSWALYYLAREPQARERLRAELAALGPEPMPEALAKAPWLEAVCHETLRLRPALGGMGRRLKTPIEVSGYELPAGAIVLANVLWAHTNPEIFPEPERFLPERFLERTYSPFEYFPFGGGNRRCIGAAFALYEMKIVLGTLLQRFTFELVSPKPVPVVQRDLLGPAVPLRMIAIPAASASK